MAQKADPAYPEIHHYAADEPEKGKDSSVTGPMGYGEEGEGTYAFFRWY